MRTRNEHNRNFMGACRIGISEGMRMNTFTCACTDSVCNLFAYQPTCARTRSEHMATLALKKDHLELVRAGRTDQAFAAELGVTPSTISRLVNGKSEPGNKIIAAFLLTYPQTFDYFFEVVDEPKVAA
jgi:hypothetical protein